MLQTPCPTSKLRDLLRTMSGYFAAAPLAQSQYQKLENTQQRRELQDGRGAFQQSGVLEAALKDEWCRIQSGKHSSAYGFSVLASNAKYRVGVDIC